MRSYLHQRPVLRERHRPVFASLAQEEVRRVVQRLQQHHLLPERGVMVPPDQPGGWLFEQCRDSGLDQVSVVLPLCGDSDAEGRRIIEKLVGKPMNVWVPRVYAPPAPRPPGTPEPGTFHPDQVVLTVAPNPKQKKSAAREMYEKWRPGLTVAEVMKAGMSRAAVLWDIDASRKFVRLGTREEWERMSRPVPDAKPAE